jgi:hypothetical protein
VVSGAPTRGISTHYAALLEARATVNPDGSVAVVLPSPGWAERWVASIGLRHLAVRFPHSRLSMALPDQAPFCGFIPHA